MQHREGFEQKKKKKKKKLPQIRRMAMLTSRNFTFGPCIYLIPIAFLKKKSITE